MKLNLKQRAIELLQEAEPWPSLMEPIANIQLPSGEVYQLQIKVTKDQNDLSESTTHPNLVLEAGKLHEYMD